MMPRSFIIKLIQGPEYYEKYSLKNSNAYTNAMFL
jgi:hypothetical protein